MRQLFTVAAAALLVCTALTTNAQTVPSYVPTNGLVGWWPFNGNANDESGNGNNGDVYNATLTSDRNGNPSEAYLFQGIDNKIGVLNLSQSLDSTWTISIWFRQVLPVGGYGNQFMVGFGMNQFWGQSPNYGTAAIGIAGYHPYGCSSTQDLGKLYVVEDNIDNTACGNSMITQSFDTTQWHHIALTKNVTSFDFYLDGSMISNATNLLINSFSDLWLGNQDLYLGSQMYLGALDDIGIWTRALTPLEIQQLYNSTPCTKPEPVTLGTDRSTKLCPNEAVTIEIVTPSTAGLSYEWTRNGTTIPGATASSISVSDAAKYKVFVRSGPGLNCQRVSGLIETTAAIPPTITTTTPNGNAYCPGDSVLMSATGATAGYSYQWKRFGVPIAGATSATFYAKQTGNYRCEVTNAGGCINQSNLITVTSGTSCRMMNDASGDIIVYPNPARNEFTLKFGDIGEEQPVLAELRDHQGRLVSKIPLHSKGAVNFDTNKLATGYYTVKVFFESGDAMEKQVSVVK